MKMLGEKMDDLERVALSNMTLHPGWKVLRKMMDEMCDAATAEVIKVSPKLPNYRELLVDLQLVARATNDAFNSLVRSCEAHCQAAGQDRVEQEQIDIAMRQVEQIRRQAAEARTNPEGEV